MRSLHTSKMLRLENILYHKPICYTDGNSNPLLHEA